MNIAYLQVREWSLEGDNEVPVVGLYVYNEAKQCVVTLTRVETPPPPFKPIVDALTFLVKAILS